MYKNTFHTIFFSWSKFIVTKWLRALLTKAGHPSGANSIWERDISTPALYSASKQRTHLFSLHRKSEYWGEFILIRFLLRLLDSLTVHLRNKCSHYRGWMRQSVALLWWYKHVTTNLVNKKLPWKLHTSVRPPYLVNIIGRARAYLIFRKVVERTNNYKLVSQQLFEMFIGFI